METETPGRPRKRRPGVSSFLGSLGLARFFAVHPFFFRVPLLLDFETTRFDQSLPQQKLDLRVDAAQFVGGPLFQGAVQRGIDPEQKGLPFCQ